MRIAMIVAGCGHLDGAETREVILSLLYAQTQGAQVSMFAPDINQHHVVNHVSQQEESTTRNVLQEAARLARGQIHPLDVLHVRDFDALLLPGGFGVAKNLSDLAFRGAQAHVMPIYAEAIQAFHIARKPIGAICIAPAVLACVLRDEGIMLTIGEDATAAQIITDCGNQHVICPSHESVCDTTHRIVSTPAYMREDPLPEIAQGIASLVKNLIELHSEYNKKL